MLRRPEILVGSTAQTQSRRSIIQPTEHLTKSVSDVQRDMPLRSFTVLRDYGSCV